MIEENQLEHYIEQHIDPESLLLKELSRDAYLHLVNPRMISGHLQGKVLKMICRMIRPKSVLEIGTFVGYSALAMLEGMEKNATLDTFEINDELEEFALKYFNKSPYKDRLFLHIGNVIELLPQLNKKFDLAFIDGNKREYLDYYEMVLPMIEKGGFLLFDNTIWYGKIFKEIEHNDKQTEEIVRFNEYITKDQRVEKVILPLRDGLTLIHKL